MHVKRQNIIFLLFFLTSVLIVAQKTNDDKLALQFLEKKDYEKANVYLEKLFDKNPDMWYNHYYTGLMGVKDFKSAEKISNKQIKRNPQQVNIYINIARIYREQG